MAQEQTLPADALNVRLLREPFLDFFTVQLDGGYSEELEPDEAREWFRLRGANMNMVEKAMDHCWNFYEAEIWIKEPKTPKAPNASILPNI